MKYYTNDECGGTYFFMRWKIECYIQRGEAKLNRKFHLFSNEIYVPSHEWKTFIICFIYHQNIFCHLKRKINLDILENAILFWSRRFRSNVTAVYHCTVLFNDRWMVYLFHTTLPCIIQSNDKNLHWCYIKTTVVLVTKYMHQERNIASGLYFLLYIRKKRLTQKRWSPKLIPCNIMF